jgi:hypothetical protein
LALYFARLDTVVDGGADTIVVGGEGKDLDLVVDRLDSRDSLDGVTGVALEDGAGGVALEDEGFAMEAEGEPVEDAVVREAAQFLLHLGHDLHAVFLRPGGAGGLGDEVGGSEREDESGGKGWQGATGQTGHGGHGFTPYAEGFFTFGEKIRHAGS